MSGCFKVFYLKLYVHSLVNELKNKKYILETKRAILIGTSAGLKQKVAAQKA